MSRLPDWCFCNLYASPFQNPAFVLPSLPCPRFSRTPRSNRCGCGHLLICHKILNITMLPTPHERVAALLALDAQNRKRGREDGWR